MFHLSPHLSSSFSSFGHWSLVFMMRTSKMHFSCAFFFFLSFGGAYYIFLPDFGTKSQTTIKLVMYIRTCVSCNFFLILSTRPQSQLYSTNLFKMPCYPHIHPSIRPPTPPAGRFSVMMQTSTLDLVIRPNPTLKDSTWPPPQPTGRHASDTQQRR